MILRRKPGVVGERGRSHTPRKWEEEKEGWEWRGEGGREWGQGCREKMERSRGREGWMDGREDVRREGRRYGQDTGVKRDSEGCFLDSK